jgi:hypothetical protein
MALRQRSAAFWACLAKNLVTTVREPEARTVICSPTTLSGAGLVAGVTTNESGVEIPLFCFGFCRNGRRIPCASLNAPPMRRVPVGLECVNSQAKSLITKRPTPEIMALTVRAWLAEKDPPLSLEREPVGNPELSSSACGAGTTSTFWPPAATDAVTGDRTTFLGGHAGHSSAQHITISPSDNGRGGSVDISLREPTPRSVIIPR